MKCLRVSWNPLNDREKEEGKKMKGNFHLDYDIHFTAYG